MLIMPHPTHSNESCILKSCIRGCEGSPASSPARPTSAELTPLSPDVLAAWLETIFAATGSDGLCRKQLNVRACKPESALAFPKGRFDPMMLSMICIAEDASPDFERTNLANIAEVCCIGIATSTFLEFLNRCSQLSNLAHHVLQSPMDCKCRRSLITGLCWHYK